MHPRLLTKSLLAATLLASTLSCTKKDAEAPTPLRGTGSYKVGGRPVSGISLAFVYTNTTQKTDRLSIVLSDTPVYQSNTQTVFLIFEKPTDRPSTAYQLTEMSYTPDNTNNFNKVSFTNDVTTLQETSPGVFSGTFSGTSTSSGIAYTLSEGIFTDARL